MDRQQFDELRAGGYNRIPVAREILADLDTPLSTYLKLARGPNSYLFESVVGGERWGRYSIIGLPATTVLQVRGHTAERVENGAVVSSETVDDPLARVEAWQRHYRVAEVPGLPRFTGGLVGYFGYETVRYIEPRLNNPDKADQLGTPDIRLVVSEEVVVFDNLGGRLFVIVLADDADDGLDRAHARLDELVERMAEPMSRPEGRGAGAVSEEDFSSGFGRDEFCGAVERARDYIRDGDIMQVVLSQRLSTPFDGDPVNVYRALRSSNPSPYMYFLDCGDFQVVGASPEMLVRVEDGDVAVRPIAGTRRRGANPAEDRALADELLDDPKERAEHLMLIDLGRNDVGRVAEIGSVRIPERMTVERYSHVMHIVSQVTGRLAADMDAMDALRTCFPAGTVSGAPKIRAMEIIDEFEPVKRGVYSGAVGYLGWNGNLDTAIAIRTALVADGQLHIQAGAGIVHDSDPASEWDETMNKARAIVRAVDMVGRGLDGRDLREL